MRDETIEQPLQHIKKIYKILSCSLSDFAVHNPKSRDVFFTVCLVSKAIYRSLYEKDGWQVIS